MTRHKFETYLDNSNLLETLGDNFAKVLGTSSLMDCHSFPVLTAKVLKVFCIEYTQSHCPKMHMWQGGHHKMGLKKIFYHRAFFNCNFKIFTLLSRARIENFEGQNY